MLSDDGRVDNFANECITFDTVTSYNFTDALYYFT